MEAVSYTHLDVYKRQIKYPIETQIFSSVFTERLIEEAIKRKCNIIIEDVYKRQIIGVSKNRARISKSHCGFDTIHLSGRYCRYRCKPDVYKRQSLQILCMWQNSFLFYP